MKNAKVTNSDCEVVEKTFPRAFLFFFIVWKENRCRKKFNLCHTFCRKKLLKKVQKNFTEIIMKTRTIWCHSKIITNSLTVKDVSSESTFFPNLQIRHKHFFWSFKNSEIPAIKSHYVQETDQTHYCHYWNFQ